MNKSGISGKANNPVKDASGKLKNNRTVIHKFVVNDESKNKLKNCKTMKPNLTANSEWGKNEKILITNPTNGG